MTNDKPASDGGAEPERLTVEEQWEKAPHDAKAQGKVWAELAASAMSGMNFSASFAAPKKPSRWARFRSAITVLFVSKKYAEANPDTTIREKAD